MQMHSKMKTKIISLWFHQCCRDFRENVSTDGIISAVILPVNPSLLKLRLKRRPKAAGVLRSDTAAGGTDGLSLQKNSSMEKLSMTQRIFTDPQMNINTLMQILRDLKKRLLTFRWKLLIWCVRNVTEARHQRFRVRQKQTDTHNLTSVTLYCTV